MNIFGIDKYPLKGTLEQVREGSIQLPDFQRDWRWNDEHIRSLLASVSRSFPIGMVMLLENGGSVRFKTRPLEGTPPAVETVTPDILVLDGQQRLTALFQSLMSGEPVLTKRPQGHRWYYLDMHRCVADEANREEAVISVSENRILKKFGGGILNLSTPEQEYAKEMFPVSQIFNANQWMKGYLRHWNLDNSKWDLYGKFDSMVIQNFEQFLIPFIEIGRQAPREAVCLIFEKVNRQGMKLNVFELLTASLAAHNFQLRKAWQETSARLKDETRPNLRVLHKLKEVDFLQILTLLATDADPTTSTSCSNAAILQLDVETYRKWTSKAEEGLERAADFLNTQSIFDARGLPYPAQLVPLAAILAHIGNAADSQMVREKLALWYWCGVLGELYGSSADTRFANDLAEVPGWLIEDAGEPATIREATFQENRLEELQTRASAAYKGIHALIMRNGCLDFQTSLPINAQKYFDDQVDIRFIFPKAWCEKSGIKKAVYNSIINKTPISERTRRLIDKTAPSKYLEEIWGGKEGLFPPDEEGRNKVLGSHLIWVDALREDDFELFFEARKQELLKVIVEAMGKPVVPDKDDDSDASA